MQSTRERQFNNWTRIGCLVYVIFYVILCLLFPKAIPYTMIPYAIVFTTGMAYRNRRLNALRREASAKS